MDVRQRLSDQSTAIDMAIRGKQGQMWTALPGVIQSFNATAMTCEVQPAIQGVLGAKDGTSKNVNLPLLVDCPVQFASGGGVTHTFPIAKGDECLVIFASRCIDAWWQNGGVQPPLIYRMHDLSDGFVIAGIRSQPRVLSGVSTTESQLRSDDGSTYIGLNPTAQTIDIVAPGGLNVTATVNVTGDVVVNGISFNSHYHTGVQTGGGNTGGPA